ncbi:MAG: hypothetical protein GC137_06085 [Alphaproteobacteria bacterium]|nr:hypothetical protein [Alphaproteobacteria bacterium]
MNTQRKELDCTSEPKDMVITAGDWFAMELFAEVLRENIETTQRRADYFDLLMDIIRKRNEVVLHQDNQKE